MSMEIGNVTSQIMDLKTDKPGVTRREEVKTGFANVRDYTKYLQEKYSYMNVGEVSMKGIRSSVNVSPAFLDKCNKDPQKAAWLEENLAAIPGRTEKSIANCMGTLIAQGWEIDAGSFMISAVGTDVKSVTEQFVSKMNAEATGIISSFDAKA